MRSDMRIDSIIDSIKNKIPKKEHKKSVTKLFSCVNILILFRHIYIKKELKEIAKVFNQTNANIYIGV
jgi:hypothetical protein